MKIYYIRGSLTKNGFKSSVLEIECTEKPKTFHTKNNSVISKDKIMNIKTDILESHKMFFYYTYALEGDQQKALDMIKSTIIEKVNKIKAEFDEILKWLK